MSCNSIFMMFQSIISMTQIPKNSRKRKPTTSLQIIAFTSSKISISSLMNSAMSNQKSNHQVQSKKSRRSLQKKITQGLSPKEMPSPETRKATRNKMTQNQFYLKLARKKRKKRFKKQSSRNQRKSCSILIPSINTRRIWEVLVLSMSMMHLLRL